MLDKNIYLRLRMKYVKNDFLDSFKRHPAIFEKIDFFGIGRPELTFLAKPFLQSCRPFCGRVAYGSRLSPHSFLAYKDRG
jgi:hypothetical protein